MSEIVIFITSIFVSAVIGYGYGLKDAVDGIKNDEDKTI